MKKQPKKLTLAKETVRSLDLELGDAVGGSGTINCSYPSDYRYCPRMPNTSQDGNC
jgi:hypothetical protein